MARSPTSSVQALKRSVVHPFFLLIFIVSSLQLTSCEEAVANGFRRQGQQAWRGGGGPASSAPAGFVNAIALQCQSDASTEFVTLGDVGTGGATQLTIAGWFRNPAYGTEDVVSKLTSSGSYEWNVSVDSSARLMWVLSGNGTTFSRWRSAASALPTDAWVHFLLSYDSTQPTDVTMVHAWINGVDVTTGGVFLTSFVGMGAIANVALAAHICSSGGAGVGNPFTGYVDEIAIWVNSVRVPLDVRSAGGVPLTLPGATVPPTYCYNFEAPDTTGAGGVGDKCDSFPGTFTNGEVGDFQSATIP